MHKSLRIAPIITLVLTALIYLSASSSSRQVDGLSLAVPNSCPSGGCAAGQRLNFQVEFSINTPYTGGPNTQVCIYAPSDGDSGPAIVSWANTADITISNKGLISGQPYTQGDLNTVCSGQTDPGDIWIAGAYATLSSPATDQLGFSFSINRTTNISGNIKVKVHELDPSDPNWNPVATFSQMIPVAPRAALSYVASNPTLCNAFTPCYVDSGDDLPTGLGTGLRDAVYSQDSGGEIIILTDITLKDETVVIDKAVTIHGQTNARITYLGSDCSSPLLSMTGGGVLQNLTINDGNCTSPSRDLIEVNSTEDVAIEHLTLHNGNHAVLVKDNTGDVTVAFNQIIDNMDYAILRENGTGSGSLEVYANNILDNRSGYQVNCNNHGAANHNFWGQSTLPTSSAINCSVSNSKRLGAPILLSVGKPGVQALRQKVTTTNTSLFNGNLSLQHTAGSDYDLILVNHGQGTESNIPFVNSGAGPLTPCSNFYDIFLAENAIASNLLLSLKYDLNSACINTIESSIYCGQANSAQYPLWWYDPADNVTNGWNRTGQNPNGVGAGGAAGQATTCDMANDQLIVTIDNTGKPGLSSDLSFTPFVAGLPLTEGITLSQLTATFNLTQNDIRWVTTSETNIAGFHVLRSDTQAGTYNRISPRVEAFGDTYIGGIYNYLDQDIIFTRTYFYKIEVINKQGVSIATHGPVSVLTSTATPTTTLTPSPTLTRTSYPTLTYTPYYYRSPTSYYRPATSTPRGWPTQVRTYGPTPTPNLTDIGKPPFIPTTEQTNGYDIDNGYPASTESFTGTEGYPAPDDGIDTMRTSTPIPGRDPNAGLDQGDHDQGILPEANEPIRWFYLLVGATSGFGLLGAVSVLLIKTRL